MWKSAARLAFPKAWPAAEGRQESGSPEMRTTFLQWFMVTSWLEDTEQQQQQETTAEKVKLSDRNPAEWQR